jgi:hypothetical protein
MSFLDSKGRFVDPASIARTDLPDYISAIRARIRTIERQPLTESSQAALDTLQSIARNAEERIAPDSYLYLHVFREVVRDEMTEKDFRDFERRTEKTLALQDMTII